MTSEDLSPDDSVFNGRHGVFVSHAAKDRKIAEAFVEFLEGVTANRVKCAQSSSTQTSTGIPYGEEWFSWIKRHLDHAKTVLVVLTPESVGKPWILFEAGIGKARPDRRVIAIAVFVERSLAFSGPFAVLQGLTASEEDLSKLADELLQSTGISQQRVVIDTLIRQLHAKLDEIRSTTDYHSVQGSSTDPVARGFQLIEARLSAMETTLSDLNEGAFVDSVMTRVERLLEESSNWALRQETK